MKNLKFRNKINKNRQLMRGSIISYLVIGIPLFFLSFAAVYAALTYISKEKSISDVSQLSETLQESNRQNSPDQIALYANSLISQLNQNPICTVFAKTINDMAMGQSPEYIKRIQIDKIFDKVPDICLN